MTNRDVKAEAAQQEELTLSGYGFTMIINGHDKPHIFDNTGQPVIDLNAHTAAQQKLILSLIEKLGPSWQQEMADIEAARKTVISMSASVAAAFAPTANDNNVNVTKVGYVTEASEGLPFRVVCLGPVTDQYGNVVKDKEGNVSFSYIADRPIFENDSWHNAKKAFETINKEGKFIEAGFGMADFPTSEHGNAGTDLLGMIYRNKKELGITADWIHGEACNNDSSYFFYCRDGGQDEGTKDANAAAFPTWRVKYPII